MRALTLLMLSGFGIHSAQAASCADIREKAKPAKNGKSACILTDHTVGYSRGATISTYQCGGTKYVLTMLENNDCTVSNK